MYDPRGSGTCLKKGFIPKTYKQQFHRKGDKMRQLIAMFVGLVFTISVALSQETKQRTIAVTGQAEVEVKPDIAEITFDASSTKPEIIAAKSEVDDLLQKLIKVFKELGIEEKDISASRLYISPEYDYEAGRRVFKGHKVTRSAHIRLRDLDKLDALLQKSIEAGAMRVSSFQLLSSEEEHLREEAFRLASAAAKKRAASLAREFGVRIGKVLRIKQFDSRYDAFEFMGELGGFGGYGMAAEPEEPRYLPGRVNISASVAVEFDLEDAK